MSRTHIIQDDYVIIDIEKKFYFAKVTSTKGENLSVMVESKNTDPDEEENSISISEQDVVINLGQMPKFGKVYGCNVEPHLKMVETRWGELHFYRRLKKADRENLKEALKISYKKLSKVNGVGFLPVRMEVRHKVGKYEGFYVPSKKEGTLDRLILCPSDFDEVKVLVGLIVHEAGHGIWDLMPARIKAKWVSLYHRYVELSKVQPSTIKELRAGLEQCDSIAQFRNMELSSLEKEALKHCLKYVNTVHGIRPHDVDTLLEARESLKEYWPTTAIDVPDIKIVLTDYARKNSHEFFSEAIRLHLTGTKLPKTVRKLMERTLSGLTKS